MVIVAIVLIVCILFFPKKEEGKKQSSENISDVEDLNQKMETEKDMIVYVTDNKCDLCELSDEIIKFYESEYNLKIHKMNLKYESSKALIKNFGLAKEAVNVPAVIFIRDGALKGIDNLMLTENYFRDYLMDYGFLDKSYYENDYRMSYEDFKTLYASSSKQVILAYNFGAYARNIGGEEEEKKVLDRNDARKEMLRLSRNNNFKYRLLFQLDEDSNKIYSELLQSMNQQEMEGPCVIITQENKVIDYIIPSKKSEIDAFLKKNGIYS